jgi:hypothetical protein
MPSEEKSKETTKNVDFCSLDAGARAGWPSRARRGPRERGGVRNGAHAMGQMRARGGHGRARGGDRGARREWLWRARGAALARERGARVRARCVTAARGGAMARARG